ncbi:MAG: hypothetical protein V2I76_07620 [Roseobacter sp.]|nr:hypothetical protein [Roseobacter sp.]
MKPEIDFETGTVTLAALDPSVDDVSGRHNRATDDLTTVETEKLPECPISASAEQQAAAMVSFSLEAPCFAGQPVVISHGDLIFSALLSEAGHLSKAIPALMPNVEIRAFFNTGQTVKASTEVDSLPLYDRVVVQWRGASQVQIHAREFGAAYGDEGHVWSGAGRDFSALASGHGGYVTDLGDATLPDGRVAEVYTFPTALNKSVGAVDLTIETEVTDLNCGRDLHAEALQFIAGKKVSAQELTLSVPDCEAVGSFLVLHNLLQDLTVATK